MRLPVALALSLLLLGPECAHAPPAPESPRAVVQEQGTRGGLPYVKLAFRPLLAGAARRFGEALGKVGVRILAMVVGGAVSKALAKAPLPDMGSLLPSLQRFVAAGAGGGQVQVTVAVGAAAQVDMAAGTVVLMGASVGTAEAAATAALASPRTSGDCRPESNKGNAQRHHIATDKNRVSTDNGGPWTQRFEELFSRAGMSLDDPANIVFFIGHQGPHPEAYHRAVYNDLAAAVSQCRNRVDCKKKLTDALNLLAGSICKRGSKFNNLLAR